MNGYICFWKNLKVEIEADSSYQAQQKSIPLLQKKAGRKKVKSYDVEVVLAEKNGKQVTHNAWM